MHHQIKIEANSSGHSYHSIFHKFLDVGDVKQVDIEEPYIKDDHQIDNLVRFCEMLLKSPSKVKRINILTKLDRQESAKQQESLNSFSKNMRKHNVEMKIEYSDKLHDREIRFDNGWIVKIGRGLDYFKRPLNYPAIGDNDLDFRQCLETTVDVFHTNVVNKYL